MTTYRCRCVVPTVSEWKDIEATDLVDAVQSFHDVFRGEQLHLSVETPDKGRYGVSFIKVEVEGEPEALISRMFHHGIWRKGGVKPLNAHTTHTIAAALGWTQDPNVLISEDPEDWEGVESREDGWKRKLDRLGI